MTSVDVGDLEHEHAVRMQPEADARKRFALERAESLAPAQFIFVNANCSGHLRCLQQSDKGLAAHLFTPSRGSGGGPDWLKNSRQIARGGRDATLECARGRHYSSGRIRSRRPTTGLWSLSTARPPLRSARRGFAAYNVRGCRSSARRCRRLRESAAVARHHGDAVGHGLHCNATGIFHEGRHQDQLRRRIELPHVGRVGPDCEILQAGQINAQCAASKLCFAAPSTSNSGMSGRRRDSTSAIRAKTCTPFRGLGLTKVR